MELEDRHKETYSALAVEYEQRVDKLRPATEAAVNAFSRHLKKGEVLDIGCGVGLLMETLRKYGFEASGIDLSSQMVMYAKARNPRAEILAANFMTTQYKTHYDGIFAFTYIHLFPTKVAKENLLKIRNLLVPKGVLYISTTKSKISSEGFLTKGDYSGKHIRFRKFWTKPEFESFLKEGGFKILETIETTDPYGKVWMDFIVQK
jgi:2-polyprenyl-3-methyl-5-hydroxy-6-metoxy-1,4-benzoquinol methylase